MPRIVLPVNDCIYVFSCAFCYPFACFNRASCKTYAEATFSIHFTAFASLFPESAKCPPGFISYITSLSFFSRPQISFVRSATVDISLSDVRDSLPPRLMYIVYSLVSAGCLHIPQIPDTTLNLNMWHTRQIYPSDTLPKVQKARQANIP